MSDRKRDHIDLAFKSQVQESNNYGLCYEPMLATIDNQIDLSVELAGKRLQYPLWVSSMTGGTEKAKLINERLAKACGKFNIGFALGSCRSLLSSDERLSDFAVKEYLGDAPFYANLGIAQVERLLKDKKINLIEELLNKLQADGLIVHVNPLQEYMQPEGDRIENPPLETIQALVKGLKSPVIVKEVGQGFGPQSLKALMQLPIAAIEFAAFGGTNFTILEQTRHYAMDSGKKTELEPFAFVGHSAEEMIAWANKILMNTSTPEKLFIISGGIKHVLQGHALQKTLKASSAIGMASNYLRLALEGQKELESYIEGQIEALILANTYLKKEDL